MITENYIDGILRNRWNDTTRTYTAYDSSGAQISQRPYTAAENAIADAQAQNSLAQSNKNSIEASLATDFNNMQGIISQTNADLRTDPSQEIKDIARAVRRLTRLELEDYSATD